MTPIDLPSLAARLVAEHGGPREAALELLRSIQQAEHWVSDDRVAEVADLLGLTTEEVDSIATFYSHLFRQPVGRRLILLCDGASCWLSGGDKVRAALQAFLGVPAGRMTADGGVTWLPSACVGGCDRAPAALVGRNRRLVGPLAADRLGQLFEGEA
ncbi:NADH-quinone oxidoreductase subunit NuoE [Thermaurantiacus sp.]